MYNLNQSEISIEAAIKVIEKEYIDMHTEYEQKCVELDDKIAALNDEINNFTSKRASLDDNYLTLKSICQNKLRHLFFKKTTMGLYAINKYLGGKRSLDAIDKYLSRKIDWFDATL